MGDIGRQGTRVHVGQGMRDTRRQEIRMTTDTERRVTRERGWGEKKKEAHVGGGRKGGQD